MASNQDNHIGGAHFKGPTNVHGDVISDSIIIQISKPSFWGNALQEWNESIFRWSEAPDHARGTWEGMALHALSSIERINPKIVFQGLATLVLWFLTIWLVAPMLAWPHTDHDTLFDNAISYSIATWLIPLLISLFTAPAQIKAHHITTRRQQWELQLLKFAGAITGFWTLSAIIIICALIAYYIGFPFSSSIVRNGLVLFPLLFSYIVARTIPANRLKMFNGEFKLHSADRFFCIVFLFMGPALALALYGISEFLNDKFLGVSVFLMVGLMVSFGEYKKRAGDELPDPIAILFFGFIMPVYLIMMTLLYPGSPSIPRQEWLYFGMVIIYFISETIFIATLLVRKQIKLTERGRTAAILVGLLINIILIINAWLYGSSLWPTVIVIAIMVILWQFWVQKRFEHYARIHPSFWIMQASLGTSIYLLMQGWLPLWLNALLTLSVAAVVIKWAYQRPVSDSNIELTVAEDK